MSERERQARYEKLLHSSDLSLHWCKQIGPMDDLSAEERLVILAIRGYIHEVLRAAIEDRLSAREMLRRSRKIERACLTLMQIHLRRKLKE